MKNIVSIKTISLITAFAVMLAACKKDSDGSPESSAGTPTLAGVTPAEAAGGTVVTVTGTGLGQMRSIVFDKNNVPATFQPNLNTDNSILFRVPDTAFGGPQNIILTNVNGATLNVPFKVIALPTVSDISPIDFEAGTQVTITGNNLGDVTSVLIDGTSDAATIVSKERKKLVIAMPSTAVNRAKLKITNASGERITSQELTYIPNAFP
ncbi:MAG TPA: IPT/TIG domain-containing protein, partial [Chitinophagaceae bacterium]|nr:IPT/TIG domain-containing protein [Chitinophagaceae bacterium]